MQQEFTLASLSEKEREMVVDFSKTIDVTDNHKILSYGITSQRKIAQFSEVILSKMHHDEINEIGGLLTQLVVEIGSFSGEKEKKRGLGKLLGLEQNSQNARAKEYTILELNVNQISAMLEQHRRNLLKNITRYESMYKSSQEHLKEIEMYIIAGIERLKEINQTIIPDLQRRQYQEEGKGLAGQIQALNDGAYWLEKKVSELQISHMISMQMQQQIRFIQSNDMKLADKVQSSLVNAIPLWKNQMIVALGLKKSQEALKTQGKVAAISDSLVKRQSEMLQEQTLQMAKESEKSAVSLEVIAASNQHLIDTINGVLEIQKNGRIKRMEAEGELSRMEGELQKMLLKARDS